jgi:phenylalanyl-tRNA synthetase beta chain
LKKPLAVAYAREGAEIFDGHQPGFQLTKLKRMKIRGVESYSMVCSEKELGISDEHEGIMLLENSAKPGTPLAEHMGDAVLDIAILPNIAQDANVWGVAREIAALTGEKLKNPKLDFIAEGDSIKGQASIEIQKPELNPRFVLGLIRNVAIKPSPEKIQRRLRLAGMRPINNIVDATNYVMLETGQPLHAFDYDVLVKRAGGKAPTIITRTAKQGEKLVTLDGVERTLDDFTVLVCDTAGAHSIGGVMGGAESEVTENTKNVLLEGANWNFINIRQTLGAQRMTSEAAYRFSRGVHPAMAPRGVSRALELMRQWSGGVASEGLIDEYPLPAEEVVVEVTPADARRWLGIELSAKQIADLLKRLEFEVEVKKDTVRATAPDHRMDISPGVIGRADLMEEVARVYGYENIPETRMSDELPPQRNNPSLDFEERVRDILANLGLNEIITYRLTSPENEARRLPPGTEQDPKPYIELLNAISPERAVMRKSLMASVLDIVETNAKVHERIAVFEIGPIFLASEEGPLPDELLRLAIAMTGPRADAAWQPADTTAMDFYDLKGVLDILLADLHVEGIAYEMHQHPLFHPGKCARVLAGGEQIGVIGELHPQVHANYQLPETPLLAAAINMQALTDAAPESYEATPVSLYPPVLEDLALIVDEALPAGQVAALIMRTGGEAVTDVRLFDVYRGDQIGRGKKSLAYSLTYQAEDRTLTDEEVAKLRDRIVKRLEKEVGAQLRDS